MSFSYNHAQGGEKKIYVLSGKRREKKLLKKKKKMRKKREIFKVDIRSLDGLKIERKSMQKLEESC